MMACPLQLGGSTSLNSFEITQTHKDLWRTTYTEDLRINAVLKKKGGHRKLTYSFN